MTSHLVDAVDDGHGTATHVQPVLALNLAHLRSLVILILVRNGSQHTLRLALHAIHVRISVGKFCNFSAGLFLATSGE